MAKKKPCKSRHSSQEPPFLTRAAIPQMNSSNLQPCDYMRQTSSACSVEEMQAASEGAGWDIRYTQIEPGRVLNSSTTTSDEGRIVLMDESIDRRIEALGAAPAGYVTVLAACQNTSAWLNGELVESSNIMLYQSGAEVQMVNHGPCRFLSMHIPDQLLSASYSPNSRRGTADVATPTKLLHLSARESASLRQLMHASIHNRNTREQQLIQEIALTDKIGQALLRDKTKPVDNGRVNRNSAKKTIDNARSFIDENLYRAIAMNEVAVSAAASISKLERVFRHQLGITPSQYIRARRLSAARSALINAPSEREQVAGIAMDCGFTHLGRFSLFYRMQFGETPSTTLATRSS